MVGQSNPRVQKGRQGTRRLSETQVHKIRALYEAGGITMKALGQQFSVTPQAINDLILGRTWKYTWKHTDPPPVWPSPRRDKKWGEMLGRLVAYRDQHGDCLVPAKYPADPPLGHWVHAQRRLFKVGLLSPERTRRLIDIIQFEFGTRKTPWKKRVQELRQHREQHGHLNVLHRSGLGNWCTMQRTLRRRGRLIPERIAELDALGFEWNRRWADKTHCKLGHPLDGVHKHKDRRQSRYCKTCQRLVRTH
jgi:hypothetical protein